MSELTPNNNEAVPQAATTKQTLQTRGLTLRSFFVCIFAIVAMAIWIEFEECYLAGGPFAENSPPNSAIGVILIVMGISAILYLFRKTLKISAPELVFIYAALLISAPLVSQGMWHRIVATSHAFVHYNDWKTLDSMPDMLWAHGKNLIPDPKFDKQELGGASFSTSGEAQIVWEDMSWRNGKGISPVLTNKSAEGESIITYVIPKANAKGDTQLVPGEKFLFTCLVDASNLTGTSYYYVRIKPDNGVWYPVLTGVSDTRPTFSQPTGFQRIGANPILIPSELKENLTIEIGLVGSGSTAIQDIAFMNNEAVEAIYSGKSIVSESNLDKLGANERDNLIVKPDNMFSISGIKFILNGYIDWSAWIKPVGAWLILIMGLFVGFLGFNIIMRKQWIENERFTFPMNILPRVLFDADEDDNGNKRSIFLNKILWLGFAITFVLVMLKGIHFYYPNIPAPLDANLWGNTFASKVQNPALKAYLSSTTYTVVFCMLAIALLIETDILFTIWISYLIFSLFYLFGYFSFNGINGYPWQFQQSIGSFLAYAILAIVTARHHLKNVFLHIFGKKKMNDSNEMTSYKSAFVLIIISIASIIGWSIWTNMGIGAGLLFFGYVLICGFAAGKVRAEAGLPNGYWMPYMSMLFVSAVGGFAVFGATGMLIATIASSFMFTSCFLFIPPIQIEMMELGRHFKMKLSDLGVSMVIGIVAGVFLGAFVLLAWAYGFGGSNLRYGWPYDQNWYLDSSGFRAGENAIDYNYRLATEQSASGTVSNSELFKMAPTTAPFNVFSEPYNVDAQGVIIGVVVTILLGILRGLFVWFPLHPLGYVLASTYFASTMVFTCFLAWLARIIVLRIGGAHSIRKGLIPFCVGMFLACIASIVIFDIVSMVKISNGITAVYNAWP